MRTNKFTKEAVYRRLLKNAGELWNVHQSDLESIDPVAKMLLGALAKELERVGNDLYTSDARIFDRIADFLLPEELQVATPAHGIVRLEPSEEGEITVYDEMFFEKKWKDKENLNKINTADIYFSSAGEQPLSSLQLCYRIHAGRAQVINGIKAEELGEVELQQGEHEILLGFRRARGLKSSAVRLYFDWPVVQQKKHLFNTVPKVAVLNMNGDPIPTRSGLHDSVDRFDLRSSLRPVVKFEEQVVNYYDERFLRIEQIELDESVRNEQLDLQLQELGERIDGDDVIWLRVLMPPDNSPEEVRDCLVLDNCTPVLNRKLDKVIFRLLRDLNIRRIDFDNFFLGVERAESNKGQLYEACPSFELTEMAAGSYNIRIGGAGRLDERDGHDHLNYLLDLLRDEKRSFSAMDVTSTVADLNTIEQILEKIKKKSGTITGGKQPYVVIKPHTDSENAHMHFWSCDGTLANRITPNSKLRVKNPGLARNGYSTMVTSTIGGSDAKSNKEMVRAFRAALLSRGMVVTKRDIAELCRSIAGPQLEHVIVTNGFRTAAARNNGLQRTIDVVLTFNEQMQDVEQQEHLRQRIGSELKASSNFSKPLRVILN
ncbi:MAG: hypothetical protein WAR83_11965 [Flavobacteriales bacterium]|nr:type VI secretion system baseplate subunit TssF [Flavobacteriales bacterium]